MSDSNDDDDFDLGDIRNQATSGPMGGLFGPMMDTFMFNDDVDDAPSQEVKIAVRMMKAGNALVEFMEYVEDNDIDLVDLDERGISHLSYEEKVVIYGFMSIGDGLERLSEHYDDDDEDNPFKVSDGDDPIY